MPSKFQLLRSETTRNIVRNPSVENDLDDWSAQGAGITRSTAEARFDRYSVRIVTNGAALLEGANVRAFPNTSATLYAGSAYVRGEGQVQLRVRDDFNGDEFISDPLDLDPDRWIRISDVIGKTGDAVSNDLRIHIETVGIQATTFFIDGAQLEAKAYSTTYIDGDQDGGRWNIKKHGSVSDRLSNDRKGGRFISIDEDTLGIYATVTSGIGMPPLRHNLQGQSLVPGVEFQSTKILARPIQLTVWAKPSPTCPGALEGLHDLRQDMIDIIKPDRTDPDQPFIMRYNGGDIPLDIEVLYEGGLEFQGDVRNQFFNSFVIRFLAPDPFWREDNQHVAILDPIEVLPIQNGLIGKQNRVWTDLGFTDNRILGMAIGPDGNLYATGEFTTIGGVGANGIAGYDGTDWFPLGAGLAVGGGPTGINIAFGPDGSLYVGGSFANAGGVANTAGIARWDFDAEVWNAVGGGVGSSGAPATSDNVFSMSFAPNGSLFVTGDFDLGDPAGAPVTMNFVGEWTGLAWRALIDTGTGGLNGLTAAAGLEITVGPDSIIYIGGAFTDAGGVADTDSIALWNPGIQQFASMGGDADDDITAIAVTEDGKVYNGGIFSTIGAVSLNRAAIWNGSSWSQLAGGVNGNVRWIFIEETGRVWYVGDFTAAVDINGDDVPNTDHAAIWDGSQWIPPDFTVPTNLTRMRTLVTKGEDRFYAGQGAVGDAFVSVPNVDIDSLASAFSYPIFHFRRDAGTSATLIQLLNEDTRREMTLTYELSDGEEVEIDFRPGRRTVQSSLFDVAIDVAEAFRNRLDAVVPGSDFANFVLIPGEQTITVFVTIVGNATLEASMRWQPLHCSADAGVL